MASVMTQWSEFGQISSSTSSTLEAESETVSHLINFRFPTISPFAVHHCAHVILLRAQLASSTDPTATLMLAAKSKQVGRLAESVLKILSGMPKLCIADGKDIPKRFHRLLIERIYEELLSKTGTPLDLMESFYAGLESVDYGFALAILKNLEDEDLESCLFHDLETESLCEESKSKRTEAECIENSTSMSMLLLLKMLANGPPYSLTLETPPQELMNTLLTLWSEALNGVLEDEVENLYTKFFIDLCGQVNIEQLFHMRFVNEDNGFHDDFPAPPTPSDSILTSVTPLTSVSDFEVTNNPVKNSWLSCFSILKIFSKQKSTEMDGTVSNGNAWKDPSRRRRGPLSRSGQTYTITNCTFTRKNICLHKRPRI